MSARVRRQVVHQYETKTMSLPAISHDSRYLRNLLAHPIIAHDTNDLLKDWFVRFVRVIWFTSSICCDEGHAFISINAREPTDQFIWKLAQQMCEPQKACLRGETEVKLPEPLHVVVLDRPHRDHYAIAQRAEVNEVLRCPNRPRNGGDV